MLRTLMLGGFLLLASVAKAEEKNAALDPYAKLADIIKLEDHRADPKGCHLEGTIDHAHLIERLGIFREAWLSRDFSLDFYQQRVRQFAAYVIAKHAAEMMTEEVYNNHKDAPACSFKLSAMYDDKYGQTKTVELVKWKFDNEIAAKVNWEKIDARFFNEIAKDYKFSDEVMEWTADEPQVRATEATPEAPQDSCDMLFFNANAIFIRATTFCKRNYMDSEAGYKALDGSKKCMSKFSSEEEVKAKALAAMKILDDAVRKRGRRSGCALVEAVAQEVIKRK